MRTPRPAPNGLLTATGWLDGAAKYSSIRSASVRSSPGPYGENAFWLDGAHCAVAWARSCSCRRPARLYHQIAASSRISTPREITAARTSRGVRLLAARATTGAAGLVSGSAWAPAWALAGAARVAAASMARPASTLPLPDPAAWPPGGRTTVLVVSAWLTWAGVRCGNWALISAAMPLTIALAAAVLLTLV